MKTIKFQYENSLYTRAQARRLGKTKLVNSSRKLQVTLKNGNRIFMVPVIANRGQTVA